VFCAVGNREGLVPAVNSTVISTLIPLPDVGAINQLANTNFTSFTWLAVPTAISYNVTVSLAVAPFTQVFATSSPVESINIQNTSLPQIGGLYTISVIAVKDALGTITSSNPSVKTFTTALEPTKYASFKASVGLSLSGTTTNISNWVDQAGGLRSIASPAVANYPLKTLNASGLTVVRVIAGNQGFLDVAGVRIMPRNSDYTKMVVFMHTNASDITSAAPANYFSTFGAVGNVSLMWRNSGTSIQIATNFNTFQNGELNSGLGLTAGRWYAAFHTFNNTTKEQALYINKVQGAIVSQVATASNGVALTVDGATGVCMLSDSNNGAPADYLEVATWNIALTHAQVAGVVTRLGAAYPGAGF
jgi:hypothetical protein